VLFRSKIIGQKYTKDDTKQHSNQARRTIVSTTVLLIDYRTGAGLHHPPAVLP